MEANFQRALATVLVHEGGFVEPVRLIDDLCTKRLAFLASLPHWPTFKRGWTTRVERVRKDATAMAAPGAAALEPAAAATHHVTASPDLNLRNAPSTSGAVLDKLPTGAGVVQLPDAAVEGGGHRWVKVRAVEGGREGWVASKFLQRAG